MSVKKGLSEGNKLNDMLNDIDYEKQGEEKRKPEILLPSGGKLISVFADEIGDILKKTNTMFFRTESREIFEIGEIGEGEEEKKTLGFIHLKGDRFVTVIEKYVKPVVELQTQYGKMVVDRSMSSTLSKILLVSPQLQDKLPKIRRIFPIPIPIILKGKLTFPDKGYDSRFESWTPHRAPEIDKNMELNTAKDLLHEIYGEFCFKNKQDYTNAIAGAITPFLRGLFPTFNTRTPFFLYVANRERAGKDYCAGITGIIYEGFALEEPPISSGEKSNNNEELRKKLLAALIAGRKRLHFANNKGYINNAILEGFLTTKKYSDRALGRNEILSFDNEIDVSGSGNVGIGFTPDLANRTKFVSLFLDIEDANARNFKNPNLHQWVADNRGKIISALHALVRNWFDKGCLNGTIPFSSFPEWARICGGIMENAGYDSPCVSDSETLAVGGDVETRDMKALFERCYELRPNEWIDKSSINSIVQSDEDMFGYLDFSKKSDQTNFGKKLTRFTGRILSDISMKIYDKNQRASRQKFMFVKEKSSDNLINNSKNGTNGNLGNLKSSDNMVEDDYNIGREIIANVTKSAKTSNDREVVSIPNNPKKI